MKNLIIVNCICVLSHWQLNSYSPSQSFGMIIFWSVYDIVAKFLNGRTSCSQRKRKREIHHSCPNEEVIKFFWNYYSSSSTYRTLGILRYFCPSNVRGVFSANVWTWTTASDWVVCPTCSCSWSSCMAIGTWVRFRPLPVELKGVGLWNVVQFMCDRGPYLMGHSFIWVECKFRRPNL